MKNLPFLLLFTAAFARKGFGPTEQEWGYVTVREGAHMFWWLHQTAASVSNYTEKPLVIWLQGGPGASSTGYGNFAELGPLDIELNPRNTTWLRNYNVLFVDNPVGAGFSYTDSNDTLTTNNKQIADDFLVFLKEFYQTVPELKNTPLYIFSESYGGKMTAEIALVIDKAVKNGEIDIKLKAIGLGDPWISPIESMLFWAPYLLSVGGIDQNGYENIQKYMYALKKALDEEDYETASKLRYEAASLTIVASAGMDFYNILTKVPVDWELGMVIPGVRDEMDDLNKIAIIMNGVVKEALGDITSIWSLQSGDVFQTLDLDFLKPVVNLVEEILATTDIKVAVYNGQLDLVTNVLGTMQWVDNLKFNGADKWKTASRDVINVDNVVEGYYKKVGNLAFYWVNRAGHMVSADNPKAMDFILDDVINGK